LPMYPQLSEEQQATVVEALKNCLAPVSSGSSQPVGD
jgi:dTDP-4-amino-4,6-dideoxygalactose transaminase